MPASGWELPNRTVPGDLDSPFSERVTSSEVPHHSFCDLCRGSREPTHSAYSDDSSFSRGVETGRRLQRDQDRRILYRYQDVIRGLKRKNEDEVLLRKRYRLEAEILAEQVAELRDRLLATQIAYEELARDAIRNLNTDESAWRVDDQDLPVETRTPSDSTDADISFFTNNTRSSSSNFGSDYFDAVQQVQVIEELEPVADAGQNDDLQSLDDDQLCSAIHPESDEAQIPSGSTSAELDISRVSSLIAAAHSVDAVAQRTVRALIKEAKKTPEKQSDDTQRSFLQTWKRQPIPSPGVSTQTVNRLEIFVDASGYGIGFIFRDNWLAWRFRPDAHSQLPLGSDGHIIMSWAELVAAEMGIRTLLSANYRDMVVTIRSDNYGVVRALTERKWKEKYGLGDILNGIFNLCKSAGLQIEAKWVSTKENPADKPSRGVYPPSEFRFDYSPELPIRLAELIEAV